MPWEMMRSRSSRRGFRWPTLAVVGRQFLGVERLGAGLLGGLADALLELPRRREAVDRRRRDLIPGRDEQVGAQRILQVLRVGLGLKGGGVTRATREQAGGEAG